MTNHGHNVEVPQVAVSTFDVMANDAYAIGCFGYNGVNDMEELANYNRPRLGSYEFGASGRRLPPALRSAVQRATKARLTRPDGQYICFNPRLGRMFRAPASLFNRFSGDPEEGTRIIPDENNLRGRFTIQNGKLCGDIRLCCMGKAPCMLKVEIELQPIIEALRAWHQKEHANVSGSPEFGSFFSSIGKLAKKIGHAALHNVVIDAAKAVAKSPITGAIVSVAAVAFPPVGAPALAAYAVANRAVNAMESGEKAANALGALAKGHPSQAFAVAANYIKENGGSLPASAGALGNVAAQQAVINTARAHASEAVKVANKVKTDLKKISAKAKAGDPDALKTAKVIAIVHAHNTRVKTAVKKQQASVSHPPALAKARGLPGTGPLPSPHLTPGVPTKTPTAGILVTPDGKLVTGHFNFHSAWSVPALHSMLKRGPAKRPSAPVVKK